MGTIPRRVRLSARSSGNFGFIDNGATEIERAKTIQVWARFSEKDAAV